MKKMAEPIPEQHKRFRLTKPFYTPTANYEPQELIWIGIVDMYWAASTTKMVSFECGSEKEVERNTEWFEEITN